MRERSSQFSSPAVLVDVLLKSQVSSLKRKRPPEESSDCAFYWAFSFARTWLGAGDSCVCSRFCVCSRVSLGRSSGADGRWRLEAWLGGERGLEAWLGGIRGLEARMGGHMGWEGPIGTGKCKLQDAGGRAIGGCPQRMKSVWMGRACRNGQVQLQDPGASTTVVVSTGPVSNRIPYLDPNSREGAIALTGRETLDFPVCNGHRKPLPLQNQTIRLHSHNLQTLKLLLNNLLNLIHQSFHLTYLHPMLLRSRNSP